MIKLKAQFLPMATSVRKNGKELGGINDDSGPRGIQQNNDFV